MDGVVRSLLAWPGLARLGGVSLVLAGATGIAGVTLTAWLFVRESRPYSGYESAGWLWTATDLMGLIGELLVVAGLVGVYALLARRRGLVRALATLGLSLAVVPTVVNVGFWAREYLLQPSYFPSNGVSFFTIVSLGSAYVWPAGLLLLGASALGMRGLGRWRVVLLLVGLTSTPLPGWLLYAVSPPRTPASGLNAADFLVFGAPQALVDFGWIVLGCAMWGAKKREDALLARDRGMLEEANRDRARRLYAGIWGDGNPEVLEDLVSADIVDAGRGTEGREGFARGVAGLRRSFPDLRFGITGQSADGDRVVTRWEMSGTDKGGVLWYPPTGKEATFTGTFTDRFSDGRLVEHRQETDTGGLLQQLGLPRSG